MSDVKAVPDGFNTVNCYMVVKNSREALGFYGKAFGAETGVIMPGPDGQSTMHAEMRVGNSTIMLTDENPAWNMKSPLTLGGSPQSLHLCVNDADAVYSRAIEAGCEATMPIQNMFWGDRYGKVKDPYGHEWGIATHVEDVAPAEMGQRAEEWFAKMQQGDCEG